MNKAANILTGGTKKPLISDFSKSKKKNKEVNASLEEATSWKVNLYSEYLDD